MSERYLIITFKDPKQDNKNLELKANKYATISNTFKISKLMNMSLMK